MRDLGPATEGDMVLAFVQAEIDSARFGPRYAAIRSNSGLERSSIVDEPNLQSDTENRIRRGLLTAVRGYGNRTLLFKGFPGTEPLPPNHLTLSKLALWSAIRK
jgi:hypothetical protein